jgi:hypothetical protein
MTWNFITCFCYSYSLIILHVNEDILFLLVRSKAQFNQVGFIVKFQLTIHAKKIIKPNMHFLDNWVEATSRSAFNTLKVCLTTAALPLYFVVPFPLYLALLLLSLFLFNCYRLVQK